MFIDANVFLAAFLTMATLPVTGLPVLIAPALQVLFSFENWVPWLPINALVSGVMLAAVAGLLTAPRPRP